MSDLQPTSTSSWLIEQHLLDQLRRSGPLSRGELVARTGLARTTVVNTLQGLAHRGVVGELAEPSDRTRSVGRPAVLVTLADPADVAVLELARRGSTLSVRAGGRLERAVLGVTFRSELAEIGEAVSAELAKHGFSRQRPPACVVASLPLPLRGDRGAQPVFVPWAGLRNSPRGPERIPEWLLEDPSARLRELLNCPVLVENDGNLAAYGEAHAGAGRGHALILHVSVKEGIGAGFVFDGALFRGATGIAGELAHVSIQDDGAQCICGNRGCLTTFEPGPFLVDKVGALYGQQLQYPEIELLVEQGDPAVIRILNDFGRRIGKPLAPVAALLNLDAIVVDARLGAVGLPLATGIQEALAHRVTPICYRALTVVVGTCGDDAIPAGGLALGRDMLLRNPPRA
jgi:predicted NBD/HSP70 family sugar kinase